MLKWVFLLTVWNADGVPTVYAMDTGLTGADCVILVESYSINDPEHTHGEPSCELDMYKGN